jgi:hypothetical protein
MKTITVKVTTDDGKDDSNTSMTVEKDRGAGYVRIDSKDYTTNRDKAVEFKLRQGERLVIEAYQPEAVAYDRDQGAAFKTANQENPDKIDSPLSKRTKEEEGLLKQEHDRLAKAGAPVKPSEPPRTSLENPAPEPVASSQIVGKDDDKKSKDTTGFSTSNPTGPGVGEQGTAAQRSSQGVIPTPSKKDDPNPGLISSKDKK